MSQLQDSIQLIYDKGATVIAISPEKHENMKKTTAKTKATFTLLYDKDYSIGEAFDVVYKPPVKEIIMYNHICMLTLKMLIPTIAIAYPYPLLL